HGRGPDPPQARLPPRKGPAGHPRDPCDPEGPARPGLPEGLGREDAFRLPPRRAREVGGAVLEVNPRMATRPAATTSLSLFRSRFLLVSVPAFGVEEFVPLHNGK